MRMKCSASNTIRACPSCSRIVSIARLGSDKMFYVIKVSGFNGMPLTRLDREALISVVAFYPILEIVDGVSVESGGEIMMLAGQATNLVQDIKKVEVLVGDELDPEKLRSVVDVLPYFERGREAPLWKVKLKNGRYLEDFASPVKAIVNAVGSQEGVGRALQARRELFEEERIGEWK